VPFTLSHPAAVLPLRRFCPVRLDFAALVIGSLMPDLGYYIPGFSTHLETHSLSGSVILCLPAGLLLLALFQLLKQSLCFVLPQPHRGALTPLAVRRWRRPGSIKLGMDLGIAAASVLLGSWTHIAWDDFTHGHRWGTRHIALLGTPVFSICGHTFLLYACLQYLSSLIGGLILIRAYCSWLDRQGLVSTAPTNAGDERWRYLLLVGLGAAAMAFSLPFAQAGSVAFSGWIACQAFLFQLWVHFASLFTCLLALTSAALFKLGGGEPRLS